MKLEMGTIHAGTEVHAMKRTLRGPQAICGAGPIATVIAGRFIPSGDLACVRCGVLTQPPCIQSA